MNKKILISSLAVAALTLPFIVLGQNSGGSSGGSGVTIQGMVDAAVQTTLYIASGVVVILWVVTGILFLSASGDPSKLSSARKSLLAAVVGTVLVIVASSAVSLIRSAFKL